MMLFLFLLLPPGHALGLMFDVIMWTGILLPPPISKEIGTLSKIGHWLCCYNFSSNIY